MAVFYGDSAGSQGTGDGSTAGNACTLKEFIEDNVVLYQALAAGDVCYCKNGTTITWDGSGGTYATLAVTGTNVAPIRVIGYATTITDGGIVEMLDSDTGATSNPFVFNSQAYWHFYNMKLTDIRRFETDTSQGLLFNNIETVNAVTNDFNFDGAGNSPTLINCVSTNSRGQAFNILSRASRLINCKAIGATGNGFYVGNDAYGSILDGCLASKCGADGFSLISECTLKDCLSDDNTSDGYSLITADAFVTFTNCGATNNGAYGITGIANSHVFLLNCGFYLNTTANINTTNVTILQNIAEQTTNPLFTNQGTGDYTLQSGSPWIDAGAGYGGKWDIGVAQSSPGGGAAGGLLLNPGMNGGLNG